MAQLTLFINPGFHRIRLNLFLLLRRPQDQVKVSRKASASQGVELIRRYGEGGIDRLQLPASLSAFQGEHQGLFHGGAAVLAFLPWFDADDIHFVSRLDQPGKTHHGIDRQRDTPHAGGDAPGDGIPVRFLCRRVAGIGCCSGEVSGTICRSG